MQVRIFSQVVLRGTVIAATATASLTFAPQGWAQSGSQYVTDPSSGIVYRPVKRTVSRPVETVETQEKTVYRPQTVMETRPTTRTVYTPVIEYKWEPRVHGRWNPFRQPTVAYHQVPHARWERRDDVVERTTTRTEWIAETREVPRRVVRYEREEQTDYEAVGQVAPKQADPPGRTNAIASRLRPLSSNERIVPMGGSSFSAPRIASTSGGRLSSDPPNRSSSQSGLRSTTLRPSHQTVLGQPLPPTSSGNGMPSLPMLR